MQSLIMITEATDNLEHGISVGGYIIKPSDMQMTLTVRKGYNNR